MAHYETPQQGGDYRRPHVEMAASGAVRNTVVLGDTHPGELPYVTQEPFEYPVKQQHDSWDDLVPDDN